MSHGGEQLSEEKGLVKGIVYPKIYFDENVIKILIPRCR